MWLMHSSHSARRWRHEDAGIDEDESAGGIRAIRHILSERESALAEFRKAKARMLGNRPSPPRHEALLE